MLSFKVTVSRSQLELNPPGSAPNRGPRYGDRCFSAASALPLQEGLRHPRRMLALMAAAVWRPRRTMALAVLLLRTRSEYVFVSASTTGQALRTYLDQRVLGVFPQHRLCRGVLVLPERRSDYLRGRHRQALRTNLRRAARAGITCEILDDRSRFVEAVGAITRSRGNGALSENQVHHLWSEWAGAEMTLLAARDEDGCPLAAAAAIIDDSVCLIKGGTSSSHEARWALHDHLVDLLIARGVRYLLAAGGGPFGALGFATNVQHYQRLLGYELRHVSPGPTRSVGRKYLRSWSLWSSREQPDARV
jgi:hypothetical protein